MKKNLMLFILLISETCVAGDYDDCVLDNMKEGLSNAGVSAVKEACRNKYPPKSYVPAKCKNEPLHPPYPPPPYIPSYDEFKKYYKPLESEENCIEKCQNASYWSKHFGECKE